MFHKDDFVHYLEREYTGPMVNVVSRRLMLNVVDYGEKIFHDDKAMREYLCKVIPYLRPYKAAKFFDGKAWG